MPIEANCSHCGAEYKNLSSALRGKTVRCKKCSNGISIPHDAKSVEEQDPPFIRAASLPKANRFSAEERQRRHEQHAGPIGQQFSQPSFLANAREDDAASSGRSFVRQPEEESARDTTAHSSDAGYGVDLDERSQVAPPRPPLPATTWEPMGRAFPPPLPTRAPAAEAEVSGSGVPFGSIGFRWALGVSLGTPVVTCLAYGIHPNLSIGLSVLVLLLAMLVLFGASVMMLILPFKESPLHGLANIFVPFYCFYYLITRWRVMGPAFLVCLFCYIVMLTAILGGAVGHTMFGPGATGASTVQQPGSSR